jgi:hypothetical protein
MSLRGLGAGAKGVGVGCIALGLAACPRNGAVEGSLAVISPDEVAVPADAAPPPAAGRCPQDAPWNGRVCLGHGYVACPGGASLDDGGACRALEVVDAGAEDAEPPAEDASAKVRVPPRGRVR